MKRISYLLLSIAALFNISCTLLDQEPESFWGDGSYFKNEEQLRATLYGGYARMQDALGGNFLVYGDCRSDAFYEYNQTKTDIINIVRNNITPYNSYCTWAPIYKVIQQANLVIAETPPLREAGKISVSEADALMGQAFCMRAFAYFWIVRVWGAAPLVLTPSQGDDYDARMVRASETEVLGQIRHDLAQAQVLLTPSSERVYFTQGAAYAIEAQVCAWEHDWAGVIAANRHVFDRDEENRISSDRYSLAKLYTPEYTPSMNISSAFYQYITDCEYGGIFNTGKSKESIFELSYSIEDKDSNSSLYALVAKSEAVRPRLEVKSLFSAVKASDWRFYINFYANNPRHTKYFINFVDVTRSARNVVLVRLADLILLEAEALIRLNETENDAEVRQENFEAAVALINLIRNRAGGAAYEIDIESLSVNDTDLLLSTVLNERLFELLGEGHRYFDLIRNGKVTEVMTPINGQSDLRSVVWPIYYTEVIYSKGTIEQNEYYK